MAKIINYDDIIDRYYAEWELQDICSGEEDMDWLMKCINEAPEIEFVPRKDYEELLELLEDMGQFFPSCIDCEGKTPIGERTDKCVYSRLSVIDEGKVYCIKRGIKNILDIQNGKF